MDDTLELDSPLEVVAKMRAEIDRIEEQLKADPKLFIHSLAMVAALNHAHPDDVMKKGDPTNVGTFVFGCPKCAAMLLIDVTHAACQQANISLMSLVGRYSQSLMNKMISSGEPVGIDTSEMPPEVKEEILGKLKSMGLNIQPINPETGELDKSHLH